MLIREILPQEKELFNQVANHPLQSYEWGEFRKKTGVQVERLGFFVGGKINSTMQVTFHKIPFLNRFVGYFPKGFTPDGDQMAALQQLAKKYNAIYIKMEPNVKKPIEQSSEENPNIQFLKKFQVEEGRPLFTKYTFELDLSSSEEELIEKQNSKTRYNVKLASKKGVRIVEDSTQRGLEDYLKILEETTKRQGFYAHTPDYFRKLWESLKDSGMMHIFKAVYENNVLVVWIVFIFNDVLYYPYGASSSINREVMASNLMMWEVIRFGKTKGCKSFDMWGSLGPDPDPKSPWNGFHRFKKGYGGELVEFIGSYDLVNDYPVYKLYTLAENLRWKFLRIKKQILKFN
ncbi:MAG: FemAB family protein [Candidatus Pacebacteria bacterium GW2011_GWF2_38_9]|nr:MAG: femAB [candidate division TM6 bacterium GW2011_GWF2_28_16]KKQ10092.1 MAG: FemAB family protein [Candidatus Pacebacteria bacterium GW2011_GWF1_36_5]KKQ89048.1 MAG: FemAB family protein [Candidatus Pacebacteria bacterium GW2011_GWF2_38_9]HAZ73550.1 peptidoglycan bridge formation protein FemAB [Candidatus Paceibacterota bacterium]